MEAEERPNKMQKLQHITENDGIRLPGLNHQHTEEQCKTPLPEDGLLSNMKPNEELAPPKKERTPPPNGLSRSAFKKLKKQQEWEAGRADRRLKKKEKERARKAERREAQLIAIASGKIPANPEPAPRKYVTQVPVTFLFDCNFDDLMLEQEIKSLASQITRCYSDNSRSMFKAHLAVSSFGGRLRERFDGPLEKQYAQWKGIHFFEENFVEVAEKAQVWMKNPTHGGRLAGALSKSQSGQDDHEGEEKYSETTQVDQVEDCIGKSRSENHQNDGVGCGVSVEATLLHAPEQEGEVVYLSAESDNTLTELKPYSTYIIGGLVDRNRHKGICFKSANEKGVKTAKLPIGEFLQMNSRYVLTTNHVNEIMLRWLELGDWGEAFMKVIPKRKGGALKGNGEEIQADESVGIKEGGGVGDRPDLEGGQDDIDGGNIEKPAEKFIGGQAATS